MNLIDKIHQQIEDFKGQQFAAPYLKRNKIKVRIAGLVHTLKVGEPRASDIAFPPALLIWKTLDAKHALSIRKATLFELLEYLKLFPEVRILITNITHDKQYGIVSRTGTGKVQFGGEVPVIDMSSFINCDLFDEVIAVFDGQTFFYKTAVITNPGDMVVAAKLREEIHKRRFTYDNEASLAAQHMRPEHVTAFQVTWDHLMADAKDMVETILGNAVSHAGGQLQSYKEDADTYQVVIEVDGRKQNPVVISKDMEVLSAGICLHNEKVFDMQSLVSVLREGQGNDNDW